MRIWTPHNLVILIAALFPKWTLCSKNPSPSWGRNWLLKFLMMSLVGALDAQRRMRTPILGEINHSADFLLVR